MASSSRRERSVVIEQNKTKVIKFARGANFFSFVNVRIRVDAKCYIFAKDDLGVQIEGQEQLNDVLHQQSTPTKVKVKVGSILMSG